MLVLSRRPEEAIIINGNIRIVVCEIRAEGKVRIGIEAPKHIAVDREEVHLAKQGGAK